MGRRQSEENDEQIERTSPAEYTPAELDRWMVAQVVRAALDCKPTANDQDSEPAPDPKLCCERCGIPRRLLTTLPAAGQLPPVSVYECVGCEIINLMQNE